MRLSAGLRCPRVCCCELVFFFLSRPCRSVFLFLPPLRDALQLLLPSAVPHFTISFTTVQSDPCSPSQPSFISIHCFLCPCLEHLSRMSREIHSFHVTEKKSSTSVVHKCRAAGATDRDEGSSYIMVKTYKHNLMLNISAMFDCSCQDLPSLVSCFWLTVRIKEKVCSVELGPVKCCKLHKPGLPCIRWNRADTTLSSVYIHLIFRLANVPGLCSVCVFSEWKKHSLFTAEIRLHHQTVVWLRQQW